MNCQAQLNSVPHRPFPHGEDRVMEILITCLLVYVAIGAACFAHPASPAVADDFHWRNQIDVFRVTMPDVFAWPLALWRFGRACLNGE